MKTSSKRRRVLTIVFAILVLIAMTGAGIKIYANYTLNTWVQALHKAKEKHSAQQKSRSMGELTSTASQTKNTQMAQQKELKPQAVELSQGQPRSRAQQKPSPCSSVYQKYIENRKVQDVATSAVEDLMAIKGQDLEDDPCVQAMTDLIDPDYVFELIKNCNLDPNAAKKEKRTCFTLATLLWSGFAELEYRDVDPSELPVSALHSKINFRLADDDKFFKEAGPKEKGYLFRLMDQMHKQRPDVDYGTARDELIAELYKSDPKVWKDDYERVLEELESEDLSRAIATFYEGHGGKADRPFLDYVENLVKMHPDTQVAHIYKGMAHGSLGEWDLAAKALAEAERIDPKQNTRLLTDLRKSIEEKKSSISIYSRTTLTWDLPDARLTN